MMLRTTCQILACVLVLDSYAFAQNNPVYVDDSPLAWELYRDAQDQREANIAEAVRLYQELLDEYALRLIPADQLRTGEQIRYHAVRMHVLMTIRHDAPLLERHRSMQLAQAQRLHDAGEYQRLILTRPWTEPALDALLRIGQQHLESARFRAMLHVLDLAIIHPDFPHRSAMAAHAWYMRGLAGFYLDDASELERSLIELEALTNMSGSGAAQLREALVAVVDAGKRPSIRYGLSTLHAGYASDLDALVAEEIWSVELTDSLYNRRYSDPRQMRPQVRRSMQQVRDNGLLMAATPTVAGDVIYINQGHTILALDRFTGTPVWPRYVDRPSLTIIDREDDHARDLNVITVEHNSLVTLSGHAHATSRSSDARVLCLDTATGELRWATRLDGIDGNDELDGLFPHSEPIIAQGRVFVLARRVSPQSLTSTYLVSLDLETGRPHWIRHVASSGSIRRAARSFSTLTYFQGDLYIKASVGAVARVEAITGETRWLHRFAVPLNPTALEQNRRPWEMDQPIVAGDQVLALLPGTNRLLVLDRHSGEEITRYDTSVSQWNSPRYLLSDGQILFAVGREIHAYHLQDMQQPLWSLSDMHPTTPIGDVHGRVQLVVNALGQVQSLVVPTFDGLLMVDGQTGEILNELAVPPGNPLAIDAQLFVAGDERLDSYMSMSRAVQMLDDRIASTPHDPEPALALLRLATRVGDIDLVLASSAAAKRAISQVDSPLAAQQYRDRLFDMVLSMDVSTLADDRAAGEAVISLLGEVVTQPSQQLDYLLARGRWLESSDAQAAVENYQAILGNHQLATLHRDDGDVIRSGRQWAIKRLAAMIAVHGPSMYAAQSDTAHQQLSRLLHATRTDHEAMLYLVQQFPYSPSSIDALERVASSPRGRTNDRRVAAALMSLYANWNAADLLDDATAARLAHSVEQLTTRHAWLPPLTAMAGDAQTSAQRESLPSIGLYQGFRYYFPYKIIGVTDDQGILMHKNSHLVMQRLAPQHRRWSVELSQPNATLVHLDSDHVVLLVTASSNDARLVVLDSRDGETRWTSPRIDDMLPSRARPRSSRSISPPEMPNGQPFDPNEVIALCDGKTIVLARRSGSAVAFKLEKLDEPAWVDDALMDETHFATVHEGMLVLAGVHRMAAQHSESQQLTPAVRAFDLHDGQPAIHDGALIPVSRQGIRWMAVDHMGIVSFGTNAGIECWQLVTGQLKWANTSMPVQNSVLGWLGGGAVIYASSEGELRSVSIATASVSDRFVVPGAVEPFPELRGIGVSDESVLVRYTDRVVRYQHDGTVIGADAISEERSYRWLLQGKDKMLLVSALQPRQEVVPGELRRRTMYVYRVYTLSLDGRLLDDPLELPAMDEPLQGAFLIDDALLLVGIERSHQIDFPAAEKKTEN